MVSAGDLNPPPGPVAPTPGPEPRTAVNSTNTPGDAGNIFKITQRGSYYITGNISGEVGKHGIGIAASGVTLDLNGFDLLGVVGSLDGVSVIVSGTSNIAVSNGSVREWGDMGVDLATNNAIASRVARVRASDNSSTGIGLGTGSAISNCEVKNNLDGIFVNNGSTISGCTAYNNNSHGFSASNGCSITGCTSYDNDNSGFVAASGCTITDCTAYQNSAIGISTNNGTTVARCTVRLNTLDGISCGSSCQILDNTCTTNGNGLGSGAGIRAGGNDNRVVGNNCTGADRGVEAVSAGNIILRNSCAGNGSDWELAANNVFGPIVDRRAPASLAVSGFSAPSSLGSTDSNANFSY